MNIELRERKWCGVLRIEKVGVEGYWKYFTIVYGLSTEPYLFLLIYFVVVGAAKTYVPVLIPMQHNKNVRTGTRTYASYPVTKIILLLMKIVEGVHKKVPSFFKIYHITYRVPVPMHHSIQAYVVWEGRRIKLLSDRISLFNDDKPSISRGSESSVTLQ